MRGSEACTDRVGAGHGREWTASEVQLQGAGVPGKGRYARRLG